MIARRAVAPLVVAGVLLTGVADAEPCGPAVALDGDPAAVAAIGERLNARGIATTPSTCPAVRTRIERRGELFAIGVADADGVLIERVVSDPGTAATVIESFVRVDVGTPLLARRAPPVVTARRPEAPSPRSATSSTRTGAHVFGSLDSVIGSDRTGSMGLQIGACIMLGPTCPSARFRFDGVVVGDSGWASTTRNSSELLVGIDLPLAAGAWLAMPGLAVGMGGVRTNGFEPDGMSRVQRETTGLRGEVHGTLSVPLTAHLAVDLSVAGVLSQETKVDEGATFTLPRDPWGVLRLGIGLRYGRR